MNRIVSITMVKNEADIVESFVRHTLSFSDAMLVMDHRSTDATGRILAALKAEGLPLQVDTWDREGYAQAEVMTHLMKRAFQEAQADLVIALDADEFLIREDGDSITLREFLQQLDSNMIYAVPWVDYALTEPEQEKRAFLLSRPCLRSPVPRNLTKIIVGRKAAAAYPMRLTQGNHYIEVQKEDHSKAQVAGIDLPGIHIAHFPARSKEQCLSKILCGWLSNVAQFTIDTYYASHWRCGFENYLNGTLDLESDSDRRNWIPVRLERYRQECTLRYTDGEVRAIVNTLRLAESISDACARKKFAAEKASVSVAVCFDGDVTSCSDSLKSVFRQTYPANEIFVLALEKRNLSDLQRILEPRFDSTVILNDAEELLHRMQGAYVQWVQAGDCLHPDHLARLTAVLEAHEAISAVLSAQESPASGFCPPLLQFAQGRQVQCDWGDQIAAFCLEHGCLPLPSLSSALFRRQLFDRKDWLARKWIGTRPMILSIWLDLLPNRWIMALQGTSVTPRQEAWTADAFLWHALEWHFQLQNHRGDALLPEERYLQAVENFYSQRTTMGPRLHPEASAPLYQAYEEVAFDTHAGQSP